MSEDREAGEDGRVPMDAWAAALRRACDGSRHFREVRVVRETPSTQDVARAMGAGAVVVAWRQTAGRGRLGRQWADTGEDGLALSVAVPAVVGPLASVAAGVAAAVAIESLSSSSALRVALKWPNDLLIGGLKAGGILVEGDGAILTIGIGINCHQREFPAALCGRATSLRAHGVNVDRVELACRVLAQLDRWLDAAEREVADEFARRDALRGGRHSFSTASGTIVGMVLGVHPVQGIRVETPQGVVTLDPRTTGIVTHSS